MDKVTKVSWFLLLISIIGCQEVPPIINYIKTNPLVTDTTYFVKTLPTSQKKNVLLEDISGVRCNACPAAAVEAHAIKDKYGEDRVVILTLHTYDFPNLTGSYGIDTFNTTEATQIISNLIDIPSGLPTGAVDRKKYAGSISRLLPHSKWAVYVDEQLKREPLVNLDAEVINQISSEKVVVNIKSTFLRDIPDGAYLSLFVSESNIISKQKMGTNEINPDYEHNFILRKGITPYTGVKLSNSIQAKQVFEKGFEFELSKKWIKENCSVVIFVNEISPSGNEVLQCIELPIVK